MSSVRLSVCLTLVDHDHIGWKSWKLIARTISPTSTLLIAQRSSIYSQGNMEKFWGENVRSTATSITSGWIESTESHVILGGGVAVCLLLSAHRAVIFAIAQLSYSVSNCQNNFQNCSKDGVRWRTSKYAANCHSRVSEMLTYKLCYRLALSVTGICRR